MSEVDISEVINSVITAEDNFPSREGFGTPMVVGYHTTTSGDERVQSFRKLSDVAEEYAIDSAIYLACAAMFAQNPRPRVVKVGRRAGAPTQTIRYTPTVTTSGYVYTGAIGGFEWTVTVQPGDLVADVCDDIVTAVNAAAGSIVTATDGTTHVDIASDAAGAWYAHEVDVPRASLTLEDRTTNPATSLATDLTAILAADDDWYGLVVADAQSSAQILIAAAWCESNGKLYVADTFDSDVPTGATDDVMSDVELAAYTHTAVLYHRKGHGYFPSARWLGLMLPKDPGTETWALRTLAGLPADDLTSTERTSIEGKSGNFYASMGGSGRILGAFKGGITGSGRFLDLVRYMDSLNAGIKEDGFDALVGPDKLPMSNAGLSVIGAAIRARLKSGERIGALRNIELVIPDVDDIPEGDRAERIASGFEWSAIYTGAIHEVAITGSLSL